MIRYTLSLFLIVLAGCDTKTNVAPTPQPKPPEPTTSSSEIRILAWNVESGGNLPSVIASQLSNELSGYDIYALSEVLPTSFQQYADAVGKTFVSVTSVSGNDDRLQLLFDGEQFELIEWEELARQGEYRLNDGRQCC